MTVALPTVQRQHGLGVARLQPEKGAAEDAAQPQYAQDSGAGPAQISGFGKGQGQRPQCKYTGDLSG